MLRLYWLSLHQVSAPSHSLSKSSLTNRGIRDRPFEDLHDLCAFLPIWIQADLVHISQRPAPGTGMAYLVSQNIRIIPVPRLHLPRSEGSGVHHGQMGTQLQRLLWSHPRASAAGSARIVHQTISVPCDAILPRGVVDCDDSLPLYDDERCIVWRSDPGCFEFWLVQ